jgi:hypothetical protein
MHSQSLRSLPLKTNQYLHIKHELFAQIENKTKMKEIRYLESSTHQNQPRLLVLSLLRSPAIKVLQRDIIVRLEALHVLHSESSQAVS